MEGSTASADDVSMFERLSPTTRTVLRVAAGIAIAIATGLTTLIVFFLGVVTATGCFIECNEANPLGGALLLAGAVLGAAATVTAAVWGVIGWNRQVLVRVAAAVAFLATAIVLVTLAGF